MLPLVGQGLRADDRATAVSGGVAAMNCSIDWQDILDRDDLDTLVALAREAYMPAVRLLLTAAVDRDTAGFAAWFKTFSASASGFGLPPVCKLYGREPHFRRNLDAVWQAGWRAMVFAHEPALMAELADAGGDLLFRHATSPEDVAMMRRGGSRTLVATSPHYLVPVGGLQRAFPVRPPLPEDASRERFVWETFAEIDVIATDHVAADATTGPGLASQQHFLPALVHLAETAGVDFDSVLAKASTAPAAVFGGHPAPDSFAILAPRPPGLPVLAGTARDPFADTPFSHVVVAMVSGDTIVRTPAFHAILQGALS